MESPPPNPDTKFLPISGADILETVVRGNDVTSNASSIWKMSSFIQLEVMQRDVVMVQKKLVQEALFSIFATVRKSGDWSD